MEIPQGLRTALETQIKDIEHLQMKADAEAISMRYRTQRGSGKRLLTSDTEAVAYAAARMPATLSAVSVALKHALASSGYHPETLLDVGAGTGAVTWAADVELDLKKIICLEREGAMLRIGKAMMAYGTEALRNAKWIKHDLTMDEIPESADLVIASYVLNEMTDIERLRAVEKLWNSTNMMLLLIEPGTPVGFSNLKEVRNMLIKQGVHITAPCSHREDCPKTEEDWCHFSCRVSRSSLHRKLKGGEAPYEDEKFMYLALTRGKTRNAEARVLRHPQVRKGHVMLEVCTNEGIKNIKFSKKDGEGYKQARKSKIGDEIRGIVRKYPHRSNTWNFV